MADLTSPANGLSKLETSKPEQDSLARTPKGKESPFLASNTVLAATPVPDASRAATLHEVLIARQRGRPQAPDQVKGDERAEM